MIVPRTRLLIWFAIVVVPFAALAGVVSGAAAVSFAAIALFVLATVFDGFLTVGTLRDVTMELTPLVRTTQGRRFSIGVRLRNPTQRTRTLRLALSFPPEL